MRLAYNGTKFHGWQVQPNEVSVQGEITACISRIQGEDISLVGCGRTDTGVHATDYFAHFDVNELKYEYGKLLYKMNSMLPSGIAIKEVYKVSDEFHARFSATKRSYVYVISKTKNPFKTDLAWRFSRPLNVENMRQAGNTLFHYKDFTSFSKLHTDVQNNLCDILGFSIDEQGDEIIINIQANRFLRNMVRAIVGTLVEVGEGKIGVEELKEIIEKKDRSAASSSAPASGLFLDKIEYPAHLIKEID